MNIKILDSWIRDYLKTTATPKEIAEKLSLTSVSIERIEPIGHDFAYDIEITTNRPDLASAVGIAKEASAVLPQFGIKATFIPPKITPPKPTKTKVELSIKNDPLLVPRLCAVVLEIAQKTSPQIIKDRLSASGIRSHSNLIDITNYIMRGIGHPTHVMDYDRLVSKSLTITTSKKNDMITTLDDKEIILPGGDIIALDSENNIIDLLGVMGLKNSVVTDTTKRILFFVNNNSTRHIRQTSMNTGIRTEAAVLNEKGIDPELTGEAFIYGIQLFEELADAKIVSEIYDSYPKKWKETKVTVTEEKINSVIGVNIPLKKSIEILEKLGFKVTIDKKKLTAIVPSSRHLDITIPEDLIEEIARVYGYHNLPSILPGESQMIITKLGNNPFFWENRTKEALKYWGYTEVYTYSMVSANMIEGELANAVKLKNPLTEDMEYMRQSLIPSMLQVVANNKQKDNINIFEIANTYKKNNNHLPIETRNLGIIIKRSNTSYFEAKGLVEQIATDLGINKILFRSVDASNREIEILIDSKIIGVIEILNDELIDIEINYDLLISYATLKKTFTPLAKYPPIFEDISFIINEDIPSGDIIKLIKKQDRLIREVTLLDRYKDSRTFHIVYQDASKNLTTSDVTSIREKIIKIISSTHNAKLK